MFSPFFYDKVVFDENFYGRDEELEKIDEIVKYSNNLLLYSKRRMGKSSLIQKYFSLHSDKYHCIYLDIFTITSKEDFAKQFLKAISNFQKSDLKSTVSKLSSLFKRVRVEPTIDTNTLEYSIKPIIATLDFEEMMEDIFHSLNELAIEKKVVIAIDEFQQIATIKDVKLDAILRSFIQKRENISFVFLGSKRHLLTSLFEYRAPLYELANHFELQPLNQVHIYMYTKKYINIDEDSISYIYEKADGETKIMQHVFHLLYIRKFEKTTNQMIDECFEEIINSKDSSYGIFYDSLSLNQKTALKILGTYKSNIFSNEVLKEFNIKKQTLQSAIESLFKKEIIDKKENTYFIPDRTLELWIEKKF